MDDYLGFPLPSLVDRGNILRLYYDSLIAKRKLQGHGNVTQSTLTSAAKTLEGFSGREISKLMLSVLNAVYGTADTKMTEALFKEVVEMKVREHQQKGRLMGSATSSSGETVSGAGGKDS